MFISSISYPNCSILYCGYIFIQLLKRLKSCCTSTTCVSCCCKHKIMLLFTSAKCTICMYRKLWANIFPFRLYVLLYIMVVRISVEFIRKKMFLIEAVFILICCISNMLYMIIYYKMILPENEFSHLKGVNNQPYLDIRTSASPLTKSFFQFSCISLFSFYSATFSTFIQQAISELHFASVSKRVYMRNLS